MNYQEPALSITCQLTALSSGANIVLRFNKAKAWHIPAHKALSFAKSAGS